MPVYFITSHAYRSWSEDHRNGFVQRDEGLQESSKELAAWRAEHSEYEPAKFERDAQKLLLDVVEEIARERKVRLHGSSATRTHVHKIISFRSPACTCGASVDHCRRGCPGRDFAEQVITRMKRKMGQMVAKLNGTSGRPWFSRGWDLTAVRTRAHLEYLLKTYLPKHEKREGGIVRIYD